LLAYYLRITLIREAGKPAHFGLRPILVAVLPLRGRIRWADFGLVRVSGKNPKQRLSRSLDTNPEYPRAALGCLEKKTIPQRKVYSIFLIRS
jgi:hypothetical protein